MNCTAQKFLILESPAELYDFTIAAPHIYLQSPLFLFTLLLWSYRDIVSLKPQEAIILLVTKLFKI